MNPLADLLTGSFLAAFAVAALLLGVHLLLLFPLTVVYEVWKRRRLRWLASSPFRGRVSVIVPAYNEERSLRACVDSILASSYREIEVVVVNDGSTDGTERSVADLIESGRIVYVAQENGGKARALNAGIAAARGEVVVFTDADSVFGPETVGLMARWFADPDVSAVCGNDTPLSARTPLQKVLAVTTHIGTGFVRRALSVAGVLPIVTGNLGAVRRECLRKIGGFRPVWGEDLDLTFRLQRERMRIVFDPDPTVRAECPGDLRGLWHQRIRWVRSYLKITRMFPELLWPPTAPPFSCYLPFNAFAQIVVPFLQLLSVPLAFRLALSSGDAFTVGVRFLFFLGLGTFLAVATYSILLDRDFRALWYLPLSALLIVPLSFFYDIVVVSSVWQELRKKPERWQQIERLPTGWLGRWGGASLGAAGLVLLALAGLARVSTRAPLPEASLPEVRSARYPRAREVVLATHLDSWPEWSQAVQSVLQNPDALGAKMIAVGAGRLEWTFFQWKGHRDRWSSTQAGERNDVLNQTVLALERRGFETAAIVDLYGPRAIETRPGLAAVRFDGQRSLEQVCFTELVSGGYGRDLLEMVEYLTRRYPVAAIALTELSYRAFCFDDRCLASYRRSTGRHRWPLDPSGTVNTDDPSIWEWRSAKMEAFLGEVAGVVHREGKKLFVDVPVSWSDFARHGKDSGLDYTRVLRQADRIVVWDYFAMEGRGPAVSEDLARDLSMNFPADRVFLSVGLWAPSGAVDPRSLQSALEHALRGGIPNIWITPNYLLTRAHWSAVTAALGKPRTVK
jgi:cellulose synthase/poly-beta-1,6-N-acetylglucosamine synthase-like glycosyltransferase